MRDVCSSRIASPSATCMLFLKCSRLWGCLGRTRHILFSLLSSVAKTPKVARFSHQIYNSTWPQGPYYYWYKVSTEGSVVTVHYGIITSWHISWLSVHIKKPMKRNDLFNLSCVKKSLSVQRPRRTCPCLQMGELCYHCQRDQTPFFHFREIFGWYPCPEIPVSLLVQLHP